MRWQALLCALCLAAFGGSSCSLLPWKRKKTKLTEPARPMAVGTVALVNVEGKFALVDNGNSPVPPVGGVLRCFPVAAVEPTAELVATDVRRRPFTIADIREGAPHKGDRVVYLPPELLKVMRAKPVTDRAAVVGPAQVSTAGPGVQ